MSKNTQQSANNAILCSGSEPLIGEGAGFERIRRITGYLAGDLDRFNNAKRAEVNDRVAHAASRPAACPQLKKEAGL